jgi:hypothetical protein
MSMIRLGAPSMSSGRIVDSEDIVGGDGKAMLPENAPLNDLEDGVEKLGEGIVGASTSGGADPASAPAIAPASDAAVEPIACAAPIPCEMIGMVSWYGIVIE